MAYAQPEIEAVREQERAAPSRRRRNVMIGVGCLLGIVVVGAGTIITMLEHLETRNASFRPPMTPLEREQLLPPEPVLEVKPQVDGLRYGAAIVPSGQPVSVGPAKSEETSGPASPLIINSVFSPSPLSPPSTRSGKPLGVAQAIHVHNGAQ